MRRSLTIYTDDSIVCHMIRNLKPDNNKEGKKFRARESTPVTGAEWWGQVTNRGNNMRREKITERGFIICSVHQILLG